MKQIVGISLATAKLKGSVKRIRGGGGGGQKDITTDDNKGILYYRIAGKFGGAKF